MALLALGTVNQQNSQLFSSESGQSKTLFKEHVFLKLEAIVKYLTWLEFFKEIPIQELLCCKESCGARPSLAPDF